MFSLRPLRLCGEFWFGQKKNRLRDASAIGVGCGGGLGLGQRSWVVRRLVRGWIRDSDERIIEGSRKISSQVDERNGNQPVQVNRGLAAWAVDPEFGRGNRVMRRYRLLDGASAEFEASKRQPAHFQQKPTVSETVDVGFAVGSGAVADGDFDDLQIGLCRGEDQVEVADVDGQDAALESAGSSAKNAEALASLDTPAVP